MANESETIGQRLRARRVELGRTLAEVAEQAGLSLPYVSNLETRTGQPDPRSPRCPGPGLGHPAGQPGRGKRSHGAPAGRAGVGSAVAAAVLPVPRLPGDRRGPGRAPGRVRG